jgi:hypothetical protein
LFDELLASSLQLRTASADLQVPEAPPSEAALTFAATPENPDE